MGSLWELKKRGTRQREGRLLSLNLSAKHPTRSMRARSSTTAETGRAARSNARSSSIHPTDFGRSWLRMRACHRCWQLAHQGHVDPIRPPRSGTSPSPMASRPRRHHNSREVNAQRVLWAPSQEVNHRRLEAVGHEVHTCCASAAKSHLASGKCRMIWVPDTRGTYSTNDRRSPFA